MQICFECERADLPIHQHHVIPRSSGGVKTVPLCEECHGRVHEYRPMNISQLTKEGIARSKARGVVWGRPKERRDEEIWVLLDQGLRHREIAEILEIGRGKVARASQLRNKLRG